MTNERDRLLAQGPRVAPEPPGADSSLDMGPVQASAPDAEGRGRNWPLIAGLVLFAGAVAAFVLEDHVSWVNAPWVVWFFAAAFAAAQVAQKYRRDDD